MDLHTLARMHQKVSRSLSHRPTDVRVLWYGDLGLQVDEDEERVSYFCPVCGRPLTIPLEAFLSMDDRRDPRCDECWGGKEERGGE
jgi:DNA-directed RNA polymerase subunit RPC12/RpoP